MTAWPMVLMTDEEVAGFGKLDEAGFGCLRTERGCLPLAALDVDARVAGIVASIDVAQTFVNTMACRSKRRTSFRCRIARRSIDFGWRSRGA